MLKQKKAAIRGRMNALVRRLFADGFKVVKDEDSRLYPPYPTGTNTGWIQYRQITIFLEWVVAIVVARALISRINGTDARIAVAAPFQIIV